MILLPHLEGTDRIARFAARRWAAAGYQVLAVLPPSAAILPDTEAREGVALLQRRIRAGRLAVRLATDELHATCRVLVGVSLGAMTLIPVAALEPSVDAVVAMLGGGNLPWIAANSREPALRFLRLDGETTASVLADVALVDPLTWADRLDPERILLIRALWDQVVPGAASRILRQALGDPQERVYPSGHYSFGFFLPFAMNRAIQHAEAHCHAE